MSFMSALVRREVSFKTTGAAPRRLVNTPSTPYRTAVSRRHQSRRSRRPARARAARRLVVLVSLDTVHVPQVLLPGGVGVHHLIIPLLQVHRHRIKLGLRRGGPGHVNVRWAARPPVRGA